jgi:hypothetical protein
MKIQISVQIKNLMILCCFIMSSLMSTAQDRNVIWVHGFLGDDSAWSIYDEAYAGQQQTGTRKMTGFRVDYSDDANNNGTHDYFDGFFNAAFNIEGDINSALGANKTHPQNMAICHSMGGLVTRQLQRERQLTNQAPFFGGFITVGSSNQGASLANSVANGNFANFINHGVNEMSAPLLPSLTGILIQSIDVTKIANLMNSDFGFLLNNGNLNTTVTDLSKGSNALTTLNNHNTTLSMPRIAIETYETSPVHWRALSATRSISANGLANIDDTKFVHIMNTARGVYNVFRILNTTRAIVYGAVGFFNPIAFYFSAYSAFKAVQWHRGIVWMDNSESMWNALLDCQETITTTYTVTTSLLNQYCGSYMTGTPPWIQCFNQTCNGNINNCPTFTTTNTTTTILRHKNDGIVCQNDMRLDGVCDVLTPGQGVNHFEQRNTQNGTTENGNDEMDRLFTTIWDGNTNVSCNFFKVDKR